MSGAIPTLAGLAALAGLVLAVLGARILVLRHSGPRDTWLPPPSTDPPDPPPPPPEESDARAPWDPDPPEERVVQIAARGSGDGWLPGLYILTSEGRVYYQDEDDAGWQRVPLPLEGGAE